MKISKLAKKVLTCLVSIGFLVSLSMLVIAILVALKG
jgi:hypothetical protein